MSNIHDLEINFFNIANSLNSPEFQDKFFSLLPDETIIYLAEEINENLYATPYPITVMDFNGTLINVLGYKFIVENNKLFLIEAGFIHCDKQFPCEKLIEFNDPDNIGLIYTILKNIKMKHYIPAGQIDHLDL